MNNDEIFYQKAKYVSSDVIDGKLLKLAGINQQLSGHIWAKNSPLLPPITPKCRQKCDLVEFDNFCQQGDKACWSWISYAAHCNNFQKYLSPKKSNLEVDPPEASPASTPSITKCTLPNMKYIPQITDE